MYFLSSVVVGAHTARLIGKPQFTSADNGLEVVKLVLRIVASSQLLLRLHVVVVVVCRFTHIARPGILSLPTKDCLPAVVEDLRLFQTPGTRWSSSFQ